MTTATDINNDSPAQASADLITAEVVNDEANTAADQSAAAPAKDTAFEAASRIASSMQFAQSIIFLHELKSASDKERTTRLEKLNNTESMALSMLFMQLPVQEELRKQFGETFANLLINRVLTAVQNMLHEQNTCFRAETLRKDEDGIGLFVQQAPLNAFGAEIGVVERKSDDGKTTVTRQAAGAYLRTSEIRRPTQVTPQTDAQLKALRELIG